jgi:hypothetical protein
MFPRKILVHNKHKYLFHNCPFLDDKTTKAIPQSHLRLDFLPAYHHYYYSKFRKPFSTLSGDFLEEKYDNQRTQVESEIGTILKIRIKNSTYRELY